MENPFDSVHSNGIRMPYLSPSTINSFIERRPQWYDQKVLGTPFSANPNMARGTSVEHAVNYWLGGGEPKDMLDAAYEKYDTECAAYFRLQEARGLVYSKDTDELRQSLMGLVELAYKHFSDLFMWEKPQMQSKITCNLEGVTRDIAGFLDYWRPKSMVDDCKVSSKTPSGLSQGYKIQGAIYKLATGDPVTFDFLIPNKTPVVKTIQLTDDDYIFGISYATAAARALEEIEECSDPKRMMALMAFPNLDALWSKEEKVDAAKRYGIRL